MIEIKDIKQEDPAHQARWFVDDDCELHLWIERDSERIVHFQFCWDRNRDEHVIEWRAHPSVALGGSVHARVDDGETEVGESHGAAPGYHRSPIIVKDGVLDLDKVITTFEKHSAQIDPGIRRFVMNTLIGEREKEQP